MTTDTQRVKAVVSLLENNPLGLTKVPLTGEHVSEFCDISHYPDSCQMHQICLSTDEEPSVRLDFFFGSSRGDYTSEKFDGIDQQIYGIVRIFTPQNRFTPKIGIVPGVSLGKHVVWGLPEPLFNKVHNLLRNIFGDHTHSLGLWDL